MASETREFIGDPAAFGTPWKGTCPRHTTARLPVVLETCGRGVGGVRRPEPNRIGLVKLVPGIGGPSQAARRAISSVQTIRTHSGERWPTEARACQTHPASLIGRRRGHDVIPRFWNSRDSTLSEAKCSSTSWRAARLCRV